MARHNGYMDRAMRSADPRFARILGRLGYQRSDMTAQAQAEEPDDDDLTDLRAEYQDVVGKRAYHGWDRETLLVKIAEASEDGDDDE